MKADCCTPFPPYALLLQQRLFHTQNVTVLDVALRVATGVFARFSLYPSYLFSY